MKTFLLLGTFLLFFLLSNAQAGKLDSSFGMGGKLISTFPPFNTSHSTSEFKSIRLQDDGKIIAAGTSRDDISGFTAITMARYDKYGNIDSTFGVAGKVTSSFDGEATGIQSMLIQQDGKILTGGSSTFTNGVNGFSMHRFKSNGLIDSAFGNNGNVFKSFGNGNVLITSLAIQIDDKILALGNVNNKGLLVRYYNNGAIDSTFGTKGISNTLSFSGTGIALQDDGKIVIAGPSLERINNDNQYVFAVVRFNSNGSIDSSFGIDGKVSTIVQHFALAYDVAIQADKKILVCGESNDLNQKSNFTLLRYNSFGTLDSAFGTYGKVFTNFNSSFDRATKIYLQRDGKILLGGFSEESSDEQSNFALARYNYNGTLDKSFGDAGKTTTDFDFDYDMAYTILCTDSQIYLAGQSGRRSVIAAYSTDNSVLALNLISFNASLHNEGVILTWRVDLKEKGSTFIIERSNNARIFTSIGDIEVVDSSLMTGFSFIDTKPLKGRNFYRLKIVDVNGAITYSSIETTDIQNVKNFFKLYPNPSSSTLYVCTPGGLNNFVIQIIDVAGRKLIEKKVKIPDSGIQFDIKSLPSGVYTIIIYNQAILDQEKFIKQ